MSTYRSVHDIIKTASNQLAVKVSFNHGLRDDLNVFETGKMPIVWLFPMTRTFSVINHRIIYSYSVRIAVFMPDKIDSTPNDQLKLLERTDKICTELKLKIMEQAIQFEDVKLGNGNIEAGFRSSAFVATGNLMTFTIEVPDTLDYCCAS